jgi:hypothetical protein
VKLVPIEPFELKFVELGVASWTTAPYMARLLISLEIFLGIMLIFNIKPKFTLYSTLSLLIFFVLYLIFDIIINGNDGNCGCFGSYIQMTPLESIIKNLIMIPLVLAVLFLNEKVLNFKPVILISFIALFSLAIPFILYPPDDVESYQNANTEKINYPFPAALIPDFNVNGKRPDLTKGPYILSFMSLSCEHCKKAAYKLYILNKQNNLPPVYLVFLGTEKMVDGFIKETKADFPYYLFNEKEFFDIAGNSVPKIFYIKDGIVKGKFDNVTLTKENLEKAFKQ